MVGDYQTKPQQLFQQMPAPERQALLQQLKLDYRQILITYFNSDLASKQKINRFVDVAFAVNLPIPQVIEIHMDLIEEFSKQLKLEGRNEDVLLDYRLTLIDILAHLGEMYRGFCNEKL